MKKIMILLMLILIPSVNATIDVEDEVIRNILLPGEDAIFEITVKNEQAKQDIITYIIYDDWEWEKKFITMPAGSSKTFQLRVTPPKDIKPGEYSLNFRVYSQNDPEIDKYNPLLVNIVDFNTLIDVDIEINPNGLDPRRENLVKLNIKNNKDINLDNVEIDLDSEIFSRNFAMNLLPLELISKEFTLPPNSELEEGDYEVNVLVKLNNNTLIDRIDTIKLAYFSDIQESKEVESSFLISKINLLRKNNGNSVSEELYTIRLSSLEKTFTNFEPEPSKVDKIGNYYYYTWQFNIEPYSSKNINIETNFRTPLIVLLVIILLVIIIYNLISSQVNLKKKVLTLKTGEGISEMKVLLILSNKGKKVRRIRVIDYLPNAINAPTEYATIKPTKIKKSVKGLMLIWDIPELVKGEERIISYKMKSKVHIIGKLLIPRAICRYRKKGGKASIVRSNRIMLLSS